MLWLTGVLRTHELFLLYYCLYFMFYDFFFRNRDQTLTFFVSVLINGCVAFVMMSIVKILLLQAKQLDVTCKLCLQDYPCCITHDVFYSHLSLFFLACLLFFHCCKELGTYFSKCTVINSSSFYLHHSISAANRKKTLSNHVKN